MAGSSRFRVGEQSAASFASVRGFDDQIIIDTSENKPAYLLITGRGAYIRLSVSAYSLLRLHTTGRSSEEIAQQLTLNNERQVLASDVENAVAHVLERIGRIDQDFYPTVSGFWARIQLLPASIVTRVAGMLQIAFARPVSIVLVLVIGLAVVRATTYKYAVDVASLDFWYAYLLLIGSLVAHEFGHASACKRYGAAPGEIGAAIYLIYPAFYSNVSSAWKLQRWQRVVVDVGGVYFQLIAGVGYVAAYELTHWQPFKAVLLMIVANCIFSLNPVFKFDGYWVLADTLGVTNLSRQPKRIVHHFRSRMRHETVEKLPWSGTIVTVLCGYTVLTVIIWVSFVVSVLPALWRRDILAYPQLVQQFARDYQVAPATVGIRRIVHFAFSSILAGFGGFIAWRFAKRTLAILWRALRWLGTVVGKQRLSPADRGSSIQPHSDDHTWNRL